MEQTQAQEFVGKNAYRIIREGNKFSLRCIDDREHRTVGSDLPDHAVPGAGLGLVMDVIAAVEYARREHGMVLPVTERMIVEAAESIIGDKVNYHTASDLHGADTSLPCAGCGYAAASFKDPEGQYFAPDMLAFLREHGFSAFDDKPVVYDGGHAAHAVFLIMNDEIGLPAKGIDGGQAYIVHASVRNNLLEMIASAVAPTEEVLSRQEWLRMVNTVATIRANKVLETLAAGLPFYVVEGEVDNPVVTLYAPQEQAVA